MISCELFRFKSCFVTVLLPLEIRSFGKNFRLIQLLLNRQSLDRVTSICSVPMIHLLCLSIMKEVGWRTPYKATAKEVDDLSQELHYNAQKYKLLNSVNFNAIKHFHS